MADVTAYSLTNIAAQTGKNLAAHFLTFNKYTNFVGWVNATGSGTSANEGSYSFYGDQSLYMSSVNQAVDYEINSGGTQTRFTAPHTGRYTLQFQLFNYPTGSTAGAMFYVKLAKNGAANWKKIIVGAEQMQELYSTWVGFWQELNLNAGEYIDFSFGIPANSSGDESVLRVDGISINSDESGQFYPSPYSEPEYNIPPKPTADGNYMLNVLLGYPTWVPVLEAEAVLNFPSTLDGATSTLTTTVTGAQVGMPVLVGNPFGTNAGQYYGYVSAADTVTVVFYNNSGGTVDPDSATFTIKVYQTTPV